MVLSRLEGSLASSAECRLIPLTFYGLTLSDWPLIVKIHYNTGVVFIRFVGTHKEYDTIDAKTI
jgi:mRNA-degrading endonuclease HigB of HigAB toxin-antitoxin module